MKFESLLELKTLIKEYAIRYFRPFKVVHSDVRKRYTVKCEIARRAMEEDKAGKRKDKYPRWTQ